MAFGEDSAKPALPVKSVQKEMSLKMMKSTQTYAQAKEACIKKSEGHFKGKTLTDCIVDFQKKAK